MSLALTCFQIDLTHILGYHHQRWHKKHPTWDGRKSPNRLESPLSPQSKDTDDVVPGAKLPPWGRSYRDYYGAVK